MLKYFYYLYFRYQTKENGQNSDHDFSLGYFSTRKKAKESINLYVDQPGFRDYGLDCYIIFKFRVRFDYKLEDKSGIVLYELSHEYEDEYFDYGKVFGLYQSKEAAQMELNKQKKKRSYSKYPDNFCIAKCKIDFNLGWREGFDSD